MTPLEVASLIRRFVGAIPDGVQAHEWDDFMSLSAMDSRIDALRSYCAELPDQFPSPRGHFVDDNGAGHLTSLRFRPRSGIRLLLTGELSASG
jgi:hypothetical protein